MAMRSAASARFRTSTLSVTFSTKLAKNVGSSINSPMEKHTASATEKPITAFSIFSLPSFLSSHCSNLEGSSTPASSGK
jgi:hypothetical protein